jgi:hypothetical protein
MRRYPASRVIKFLLFGAIAIPVFGFVVMSLWNWLMPAIFDLRPITLLQAFGLFFLSRILFGGFGGDGGRSYSRHRMMERWERMSPEERERFRAGMDRWRHGVDPEPRTDPNA